MSETASLPPAGQPPANEPAPEPAPGPAPGQVPGPAAGPVAPPTRPRRILRVLETAGAAGARTYVLAAALYLVPATVLDLALGGAPPRPLLLLWAAGLAVVIAGIAGVLLGSAFDLGRRLPRFLPWVLWPAGALGGGAQLAWNLGAFSRLNGKDQDLAIAALALCGVGGAAIGVLLALAQPRREKPRGGLSPPKPLARAVIVAVLLVACAMLTFVDRTRFEGSYAAAHIALRLCALLVAMLAIVGAGIRPVLPARLPLRLAGWGALAALGAVPFATLTPAATADLFNLLESPLAGTELRALRALADLDRDGHASILGGGDCAPFDREVSPAAAEIPGNGKDDNCRLGDPPVFDRLADQRGVPLPTEPAPMPVVLITIDTLRPDRMSAYGHDRDTTPNIARFTAGATRFENAYTSGGWTSIAVPSMMRGLYPRRLAWTKFHETSKFRLLRAPVDRQLARGELVRYVYALPVDEKIRGLPYWLQRRGMYTVAVVDDGYSQFLARRFTGDGFQEYRENDIAKQIAKDDAGTADLAIATLERLTDARPFFLWVHFFGPHAPSTKHEDLPSFGDTEPDHYDQEILFADLAVGRFLDALEKKLQGRPYAVVLASDHGDVLREDKKRRDHGHDLGEDAIRIPMIVKAPGFAPGRVEAPVSLVDLMPTILALTGTPAPPHLDGVDLARVVAGDPAIQDRLLHVETWRLSVNGGFMLDKIGVMDGRRSFVLDNVDGQLYLGDQNAPRTRPLVNLIGKESPGRLEEALYRYLEETGGALNVTE